VQFFASSRKSAALRGGILLYAAQAIPPIDAEIAEKGHLWTETSYMWDYFFAGALTPIHTKSLGRKVAFVEEFDL
jgi:hypothetical protein